MDLQDILSKLYSLHRFGIKPGLERTERLLEALGNPQQSLRTIHVAGTNGKGSVSSLCASILMEKGLRVGLYTSPHLLRFNERIQVNAQQIHDSELIDCYQAVEDAADKISATFFEVTTALAFLYFKRMQTDICVIECGMGGRFDATNVIRPLVSIITSIDLDHQEYLGTTLEAICYEKCGIIKSGIPVVNGEARSALQIQMQEHCQKVHAPYQYAPESVQVHAEAIDEHLHSRYTVSFNAHEIDHIQLALSGEHQSRNISSCLAALQCLPEHLRPTREHIRLGAERLRQNTHVRGRIELVRREPPVILDVGHNPACMRELSHTLLRSPYKDSRFRIVFGLMSDKECREMLSLLSLHCLELYATHANTERAMSAEVLAGYAQEEGLKVRVFTSVGFAVQEAMAQNDPVLICGSFYLMEEALKVIEGGEVLG